jgi:hypothetical protein
VEIKVGDLYIHNSDGQICRVRWNDHKTVVLESVDGFRLSLTNIFSLEKAYKKKESKPTR